MKEGTPATGMTKVKVANAVFKVYAGELIPLSVPQKCLPCIHVTCAMNRLLLYRYFPWTLCMPFLCAGVHLTTGSLTNRQLARCTKPTRE